MQSRRHRQSLKVTGHTARTHEPDLHGSASLIDGAEKTIGRADGPLHLSDNMPTIIFIALLQGQPATQTAPDPFAPLTIYNGSWTVRADHPWSGAASGTVDHLVSRCRRFTSYFVCEQTTNSFIAPNGLAGGRGDLLLEGNHWTYLDKPPISTKGKWSRTENFIVDHDYIRFEEYQSSA